MRKALTAAMAAVTFGGAIAATALPAQAQHYRGSHGYNSYSGYRDYRHHGGNSTGTAIAAGALGLALGAAIASNGGHRGSSSYGSGYYDRGYYDRGYYDGGYYEPRVCESRRWVWDPYIQRRVMIRSTYAC